MGRAAVALGAGSAGAIGGALWVAAAPLAGCYTHQCDPSAVTYDGGEMVDENTYETTPFVVPPDGGGWLSYPPNVTLTVNFPPSVGVNRAPVSIDAYIGTSGTPDEPSDAGGNFTTASGALVEYSVLNDGGFQVLNATCSTGYYARFVVHFAAVDATPGDAEE